MFYDDSEHFYSSDITDSDGLCLNTRWLIHAEATQSASRHFFSDSASTTRWNSCIAHFRGNGFVNENNEQVNLL